MNNNYLYELIQGYEHFKEEELRGERLYPFRYEEAEYAKQMDLMVHMGEKEKDRPHFSIYWFGQLLNVLKKQKFNPCLLNEILTKLHVTPFTTSHNPHGLSRYHNPQ